MSGLSVVEDIFLAALEKGTPEERAAFLSAACKDDADLRRRVERLLDAHPKAGDFLEGPARPAGEETAAYLPTGEQAGIVLAGRYKLLEQIGEGGMGAVWVAEQTQPVRRKVALKLIKAGMDSKTVLSRFEAERQALALMDHPNIAKVLDGGTTEGGRPFFVMEYVKGVPFTRYCDDTRLSIAERLALFVPVCQAVQHAHQKGIIHRDLKPSNILICLYDGNPVPKVIDFGLAKAIHQPLTEHTLHTAHDVMMGTPLYMSPEQAQFNNLDVDTRTDIYALGVILYELLTGTTPLEKQRFKEAALQEMLRLIKEEEPPRPSARLSGSRTLPSLAAQRQLEPIKLARLVRGELDWIVMKCLEKDRGRRYDTATGLARDVERYLADELVEARPPTARYRLRKFGRKHRAMLTTAAAFALLLVAAAALSSWLAVKARRAEAMADEKRVEAVANAKEAEENAEYHRKAVMLVMEARVKSDIAAMGLQTDLDLAEMKTDPRLGLLRLARPANEATELIPFEAPWSQPGTGRMQLGYKGVPEYEALREFVTAAVLAAGQEYASLLPPITHDGLPIRSSFLSSKGDRLLTRGADKTARLWNTFTGRQIAILRRKDEKIIEAGLSPDGATAFTHSLDGVVRLWETKDGAFRAETEPRPERIRLKISGSFDPFAEDLPWFPAADLVVTQLSDGRLMTSSRAMEIYNTQQKTGYIHKDTGPVELWDAATGRLVARLDAPGRNVQKFQFLNGGRWISTLEGNSTLLVFSAEDGRLLTRLNHPAGELVHDVDVSPTGRRLATDSRKWSNNSVGPQLWSPLSLRVWNVDTGQIEASAAIPDGFRIRYWMDDAFGGSGSVVALGEDSGWIVFRAGQSEPIAEISGALSWPDLFARAGNLAHGGNGWVYDTRTWRRLLPPPGRKFHPDLARFAPEGRFVLAAINGKEALIDTRTDKSIPLQGYWHKLPKFGMIQATTANDGGMIRLIPPASHLNLPAKLLELWAQVAVRGEIGADGQFVKWDEQTWERKRQELAANPAPYPDFPFPGHVATDKLHWLRQEYESASAAKKPALAKQLLDRAEAAGDKAEAVRWRAILKLKPSPAKPTAKP